MSGNANKYIIYVCRAFEAEIRTYEGKDPLDIWYRYEIQLIFASIMRFTIFVYLLFIKFCFLIFYGVHGTYYCLKQKDTSPLQSFSDTYPL